MLWLLVASDIADVVILCILTEIRKGRSLLKLTLDGVEGSESEDILE